jgi:deoxyribodipyrimidine photo-lyase
MTKVFPATREAALEKLEQFLPRAGRQYAEKCKYDFGFEQRTNVSSLSPYLSLRLLTEREVVESVFKQHKPKVAEAFVQELCWRTYWKGWLEGRPQVYSAWIRLLSEDGRRWPEREDFQKAVSGKTGIEPFDHWVRELKEHGYLHNHARRWFASIWIFTLKLPWSLGAAFFMEHLLDADVASNMLSWRQVAGLQTKGKHYVATAKAIAKFTEGRFNPEGVLAQSPAPLGGPANPNYISPISFPFKVSEKAGEDYALLLSSDDLSPEVGATRDLSPKLVITLGPEEAERAWTPSESVTAFEREALKDASQRAEEHYGCPSVALSTGEDPAGSLGKLMEEHQLSSLIYYEPFIGPWKAPVASLSSRDVGVKFFPLRRSWDGILFPRATKGYFQFKKQVYPQILRSKGRL